MAIKLLELIEAIRERLDDFGGDRGAPSTGYYARWQEDDSPALWKNKEIVRLLKRAIHDVFNRAPWSEEGIASDIVGDPTRLDVSANNPEVELPDVILMVDQVRIVSSGSVLTKTESGRLADQYGFEQWTTLTGTPTHYLEPRRGWLRLFPIPISVDEVRLIVRVRAPTDFEWDDVANEETPTVELAGVPDDMEEALIVAACRTAYLKHDAETLNIELSQKYEADLVGLVGPPVSQRQRDARRYNANLDTAIRGAPYARSRLNQDWDS